MSNTSSTNTKPSVQQFIHAWTSYFGWMPPRKYIKAVKQELSKPSNQ